MIDAALEEGRALCSKDGSLAKVAAHGRAARGAVATLFDDAPRADGRAGAADDASCSRWAPLLAPLLPGRALAVDVGTGEGALLPLLSPLYERVIAVDRSAARLARCARAHRELGPAERAPARRQRRGRRRSSRRSARAAAPISS